ncbi:MAG: pilus assembly PilX N-terminal domain-containing protein [Desulfobacterales bacterium]|jgi:Tfp pilus assembly protein PilX|nr:pilus assembly PilX N-terminal domain-containing protein [Desulfobacterales bacterium]
MQKLIQQLKNEDGYFLIISTMMLLALITIISIAASNTARTEVQTAGNDLTYQRNLYLAEGATMEAVDQLQNDPDPRNLPFVEAGLKVIDDENFADNWEANSQAVTTTMDSSGKTRFRVGYEGTPAGYSLGMGKSRVHGFAVYGRTEKQGVTTIKVGYRRAF